MSRLKPTLFSMMTLVVCGMAACTGAIAGGDGTPSTGIDVPPKGTAQNPGIPADPGQPRPPADAPAEAAGAQFATSPGLRRLTRAEYVNSIADLLGMPVSPEDLP
jgi:hypothetical protein